MEPPAGAVVLSGVFQGRSQWPRAFLSCCLVMVEHPSMPRLCAAIVDRLTFGGNIIETGTDSYRLATTRARAEQQSIS